MVLLRSVRTFISCQGPRSDQGSDLNDKCTSNITKSEKRRDRIKDIITEATQSMLYRPSIDVHRYIIAARDIHRISRRLVNDCNCLGLFSRIYNAYTLLMLCSLLWLSLWIMPSCITRIYSSNTRITLCKQ